MSNRTKSATNMDPPGFLAPETDLNIVRDPASPAATLPSPPAVPTEVSAKKKRGLSGLSKSLQAMADIARIMEGLSEADQAKVWNWYRAEYGRLTTIAGEP